MLGLLFVLITQDSLAAVPEEIEDTNTIRIVVLGSSTAEGTGAEQPSKGWVNRYQAYLQELNPHYKIYNLAKGGYATYQLLPTGSVPRSARPMPDTNRNITTALKYQPHAIIINLPSNDVTSNIPISEQLANYDTILSIADRHQIPVWISTTQPRNLSDEQRLLQKAMKDSTLKRFNGKAMDFWTILAQPDGKIKPKFDCGDGIHLNDAGHEMLFLQVIKARIIEEITSSRLESPDPCTPWNDLNGYLLLSPSELYLGCKHTRSQAHAGNKSDQNKVRIIGYHSYEVSV